MRTVQQTKMQHPITVHITSSRSGRKVAPLLTINHELTALVRAAHQSETPVSPSPPGVAAVHHPSQPRRNFRVHCLLLESAEATQRRERSGPGLPHSDSFAEELQNALVEKYTSECVTEKKGMSLFVEARQGCNKPASTSEDCLNFTRNLPPVPTIKANPAASSFLTVNSDSSAIRRKCRMTIIRGQTKQVGRVPFNARRYFTKTMRKPPPTARLLRLPPCEKAQLGEYLQLCSPGSVKARISSCFPAAAVTAGAANC